MSFSPESIAGMRRLVLLVGAAVLVLVAALSIAARAQAKEAIYWNNYDAKPPSIGFADIDGSGGGKLDLAGVELGGPEGMAYDPANGRIYVTSPSEAQIVWVAVDGSGVGVLDTGTAPVESPEGIAVDPATQTVYWLNNTLEGSIGYASAAGGGGGELNTAGATISSPYPLALDTGNGRAYWVSEEGIFYANLDGSGGGSLGVPAGEGPKRVTGLNVDPAAGRIYVLGEASTGDEGVFWFNLSGVGGGTVDVTGAPYDRPSPYGLAFDPSIGRFYWGNYYAKEEGAEAFGTATLLAGGGGRIAVSTAPVSGPQDPVILKGPTGTGAPQVSRDGSTLSCSQGTWSADYPGSFVYGAPVSYAYQWLSGGQEIPGATAPTYAVPGGGSYACRVTGTNPTGSASQVSAPVVVDAPTATPVPPAGSTTPLAPASLAATLVTKKPQAVAGKVATVKVKLANRGGSASKPASLCVTLDKQAKKGLVALKCASVGVVAPGGSKVATLHVKTKPSAKGTYKLAVKVKGAAVAPLTVKVKVTAPRSKSKKK